MTSSVITQYAIVKEDTAALFTVKLNEVVAGLAEFSPVVTFSTSDPLCAYVSYARKEERPETIAERANVEGFSFACWQCPCFVPVRTGDGEIDKRCKRGDCTHPGNELGRTLRDTPACDYLYELIEERRVRLCWPE